MWKTILPVLVGITLALPIATAEASSAPTELTDRGEQLYALVSTEVETAAELVGLFDTYIDRTDLKMSGAAKSSHRRAKAHYKTSIRLHDRGQYPEAYAEARAAHDAMVPGITELLEQDSAPPALISAIGTRISRTSSSIGDIAPLVQGAPPAARAAYDEAEALHDKARRQWNSGHTKEGFRTLHAAMVELDRAVRLNWPEAG